MPGEYLVLPSNITTTIRPPCSHEASVLCPQHRPWTCNCPVSAGETSDSGPRDGPRTYKWFHFLGEEIEVVGGPVLFCGPTAQAVLFSPPLLQICSSQPYGGANLGGGAESLRSCA